MIAKKKQNLKKALQTCLAVVFGLGFASCSMLFPDRSAPKSVSYAIDPPPDPWKAVPVGENPASIDALKADLAYENMQTGAIISINSLCRKYIDVSLEELSRNLVLGIKEKKVLQEHLIELSGTKAKETLLEGEVENTKVNIRTVVLKKNACTYDIIFVSMPEKMHLSEKYFDDFLKSFKAE